MYNTTIQFTIILVFIALSNNTYLTQDFSKRGE